ncbi:Y-family DNA polymerase [Streptococcus loxodontisalivarius]|uniref:DNA polymerase V n=1 Tax=Streptococcus loxodontisalivarius TaxID=1349415 RepID=A0ABS2PPU3_9STRE|nr:DNA polymerase [Streptococcus loxodontisalivarius]MBM7642058.1 DNA polymerase V [Streptococcus loxodontisalivarius]
MGYIDYSKEPQSDIAFIDMKSFYASVECVDLGLNPLHTSLCVMSRADNSSGLILASSPMFKKVFGKNNVGRSYDLPFDIKTRKFSYQNAWRQGIEVTPKYKSFIEHWAKRTIIVPPRMDRYIEKNIEIQHVFQDFAAPNDIFPYSIDEGFIDLTSSLNYFIKDKALTRREKLDNLSAIIQRDIWRKTGIISTIGMSNANPLLAKLALDNEAKKTVTMRANWSYEDVESKVWAISKLKEFGKVGVQLWFHANGVDESNVHNTYQPKSHGLGNSQVLPRDYLQQREIEVVLSEMAEQVAIQLRKEHKKATIVSIFVNYSKTEMKGPIQAQMKIDPTNITRLLTDTVLKLFRSKYQSGAVRGIAVNYSGFVDENYTLLSLFDDIEAIEKEDKLQSAIDNIRDEFGFLAIQKGTVLLDSSRNIARSKLIGGHSAGGLDGLK